MRIDECILSYAQYLQNRDGLVLSIDFTRQNKDLFADKEKPLLIVLTLRQKRSYLRKTYEYEYFTSNWKRILDGMFSKNTIGAEIKTNAYLKYPLTVRTGSGDLSFEEAEYLYRRR